MRFLEHFDKAQSTDQSVLYFNRESLKLPDFIAILHGREMNRLCSAGSQHARDCIHINSAIEAVRTRLSVESGQSIGFMRILVARHDMDATAQHTKNEAGFDSFLASLYSCMLEPASSSSSSTLWKAWRSDGVFGVSSTAAQHSPS